MNEEQLQWLADYLHSIETRLVALSVREVQVQAELRALRDLLTAHLENPHRLWPPEQVVARWQASATAAEESLQTEAAHILADVHKSLEGLQPPPRKGSGSNGS